MKLRSALAFSSLLLACQGKTSQVDKAQEGGAPTSSAATPAVAVKAATCLVGDEIDARRQEVLYGHAQRVLTALRGGAAIPLWNDVHPALREETRRDEFLSALDNLQKRLEPSTGEPEKGDAILVEVAPGVEENLRIRCADDLQVTARVAGDDLAFVTLYLQGPVLREALVVRLREHNNGFYLVGIEGNPVKFKGGDAEDYESRGDKLLEDNRTLAGYLMYGLAQTLGSRGTGLRSTSRRRMEGKLERLTRTKAFANAVSSVSVNGKDLEIVRIGLSTSPGGIAPNIRYVTGHPLEATGKLTAEAAALVSALTAQNPEIVKVFDTALVEAYRERPDDPARAYDAFQTVISLEAK